MAAVLTDEWFELCAGLAADLPEHPGLDLVVDHEVSDVPGTKGKARFHVVFTAGRIAGVGAGKHVDADCTLAASYADFRALIEGELAHDVAYMQGRLKVDGAYATWLFAFDEVRRSPEFAEMRRALAAATDF